MEICNTDERVYEWEGEEKQMCGENKGQQIKKKELKCLFNTLAHWLIQYSLLDQVGSVYERLLINVFIEH